MIDSDDSDVQLLYKALDRHITDMVHKHLIAVEGLTTEQLAEAIKQAILAGDFVRHIHKTGWLDHSQAVIYMPGREVEDLKRSNDELNDEVDRLRSIIFNAQNVLESVSR